MSGSTCFPPDSDLDPAQVGGVVAGIHQVVVDDLAASDVDPWYREVEYASSTGASRFGLAAAEPAL